MHNIVKVLSVAAASMLGLATAQAQNAPLKMTLFGQPSVNNDAIWMAIEKGLYQEEGLDVTYRLFPSGTTAFQAFQTGHGDIVMTGDLPSVQYFFRVKGDYRTDRGHRARRQRLRRRRRQGDQDATGSRRQDSRDARRLDRLLVRFGIPDQEQGRSEDRHREEPRHARSCRPRCAAVKSQPSSSGSRSARARSRSAQTRPTISATRPATSRAISSPARGPMARNPHRKIANAAARDAKGRDFAEKDFQAVAHIRPPNVAQRKGHEGTIGCQRAADRDRQGLLRRFLQPEPLGTGRKSHRWPDRLQQIDLGDGLKAINPKLVDAPPPPC